MNSRTRILEKVKQGLRVAAPKPPSPVPHSIFSPIPENQLVSYFEKELQSLKGEFYTGSNWAEVRTRIQKIRTDHSIQNMICTPDPDCLQAVEELPCTIIQSPDQGVPLLEKSDLAITACSFLIARTGSILLTSLSGNGRTFSVLPHAHLVIARKTQLVADLSDAYQLLQKQHQDQFPSLITCITGPSRTADIEKILVLGAHGPKKLFVILLNF